MTQRSPVWPRPLQPGGTIGICSPSSPAAAAAISRAATTLETKGYRVLVARNARALHSSLPYLAGTDEERLQDLNGLLANPEVDLILCARGGYGAGRLADRIDYAAIRRDPKPLVGYSDITALSLAIAAQTGVVTFSGIMATGNEGLGSDSVDPFSATSLWQAVRQSRQPLLLTPPDDAPPWAVYRGPIHLQGPVYPVCLSLLMSLWGTPYIPDLSGAILVIEDVHEELYRVDRFLTQLRLAGALQSLAGVLIGSFNGMSDDLNQELSHRIPEMVLEMTPASVAVASGIAYGHIPCRLTIPVGAIATVQMDSATLEFDTPCVPVYNTVHNKC